MADTVRKVNDVLPPLDCTLSDANGVFDITGYKPRFVMRSSANTVIADGTTSNRVTILGATSGRVRYNWSSSEVDVAGNYLAEWELTNPSTQRLTFPNRGHISIVLLPEQAT